MTLKKILTQNNSKVMCKSTAAKKLILIAVAEDTTKNIRVQTTNTCKYNTALKENCKAKETAS